MREKEQSLDEKTTGTLLYLPVRLVDDSMFPLKCEGSMPVKVHFNAKDGKLIVEKWTEEQT
jgi:hypothetical protein